MLFHIKQSKKSNEWFLHRFVSWVRILGNLNVIHNYFIDWVILTALNPSSGTLRLEAWESRSFFI